MNKAVNQSKYIDYNYINKTSDRITNNMRRILIDWIVEVHFNFKHMDSTLNISV